MRLRQISREMIGRSTEIEVIEKPFPERHGKGLTDFTPILYYGGNALWSGPYPVRIFRPDSANYRVFLFMARSPFSIKNLTVADNELNCILSLVSSIFVCSLLVIFTRRSIVFKSAGSAFGGRPRGIVISFLRVLCAGFATFTCFSAHCKEFSFTRKYPNAFLLCIDGIPPSSLARSPATRRGWLLA